MSIVARLNNSIWRNPHKSNKNWNILIVDKNIYTMRVTYNVNELSKHYSMLNKMGYNSFEFMFNFNPHLYPFVAPNITLCKPNIKGDFKYNIQNIKFHK